MKKIILLLLMAVAVQSNFAQVGELKEVKKSSTTKWLAGQFFDRFQINGQDYIFKRNYRGNDNQFGIFDGGTLYKIDKNGTQTIVRTYDLKNKISCYTSSAYSYNLIYGFKIDYFNNSYYLFYFTTKAELIGLDLVSGKSTPIADLKFSSQEIFYSRFAISDDRKKMGITWVTGMKKNIAVYDAAFKEVLRYDRFQIPGTSTQLFINEMKIFSDGTAAITMGGGADGFNNTLSGCIASKTENKVFESFKDERKKYSLHYHTLAEFNGKKYIVGTCNDKETKETYLITTELNSNSLDNIKYYFQKINISMDYPYEKTKDKSLLVKYKTLVIDNKLVFVTYKGEKLGFSADMYDHNMQFFVLDEKMKLIRQDELFYTAVDTRNKMKDEFPQEICEKLANGNLAIVYNDCKNHLENTQSADFADFSFISDRKKSARESAIYAAYYNPTNGEIKKQLLLESDGKSNLINRFFPKASYFADNKITFDVIQGEFKKGAGEDNMDWKTYEFIFNK